MIAQNILLDSPSLVTIYLRLMLSVTDTLLATGTGFIYEYNENYYLITNAHNVTGINYETQKRLSEHHCGFPDCIRVKVRQYTNDGKWDDQNKKIIGLHPDLATVPLYEDDELLKPLWLIHPVHGYAVDVIAIHISAKDQMPQHLLILPINKIQFDNDVPVNVSDEVFVLGYPYDVNGGMELPIWKKGSVATEPSVDIDRLPKLLIDTATRPGMSGSPVIYQRSGFIKKNHTAELTAEDIIGTIRGFLGVYSGRIISTDKFDAQLGVVWKGEVIEEIIKGNIRGTSEFQNL